jgi:hypothetical protein
MICHLINQFIMEKHNLPKEEDSVEKTLFHIESAIRLIPFAGGFLASYFGQIRNGRIRERMNKYFNYVNQRLTTLEEKKIDKEYLNTEAFAEIFVQGAEFSARSISDERIRRFANVIINNAIASEQARDRTQGILQMVERVSDLDTFVLLSFGPPYLPSFRAPSRSSAIEQVRLLCEYLAIQMPTEENIVDSLIYMDNLGLTWVTRQELDYRAQSHRAPIAEFSVFRSSLGDIVASAIVPPDFFRTEITTTEGIWPNDYVNKTEKS